MSAAGFCYSISKDVFPPYCPAGTWTFEPKRNILCPMQNTSKPTFIDFFAGCGGLSLGLEQAGFYPLYVNELNDDARETYLRNRDKHYPHLRGKFSSSDIKQVIKQEGYFGNLLKELSSHFGRNFTNGGVDLVAGGPPCQGFSGIGIRRSYSVEKSQLPSNHLYQDFAFAIHQIRPRIFLFENVEGLLRARWDKNGKKGEIFQDVLKTLSEIPNYTVKHTLVYSKDYGVPQNRPRVLVVGIRDDVSVEVTKETCAVKAGFLPQPSFDYPHLGELLSDLVDNDFVYGGSTTSYPRKAETRWQKEFRKDPESGEISRKGMPLGEQEYSKHSATVVERFRHMLENHGEIPEHLKTKKFAQRALTKVWGNSGPNITATSLPDDFVHYEQARTLTVREWARLQTFPDWYQFAGKRTTGGIRRAGNPREGIFDREVPKYTQIGNAVPVKLGREVGKHFLGLLK